MAHRHLPDREISHGASAEGAGTACMSCVHVGEWGRAMATVPYSGFCNNHWGDGVEGGDGQVLFVRSRGGWEFWRKFMKWVPVHRKSIIMVSSGLFSTRKSRSRRALVSKT